MQDKQTTGPYVIKYGTHEITVNPHNLSRISKKFAALYQENPTGLEIAEPKEEFKVFLSFITIAQCLPFRTHYYWVDRVCALADEWEAPKVREEYEEDFEKVDPTEAVSELIEAIDEDPKAAIKKVARALPEAFDDERIESIPMIIIYQIIDEAEKEGFEAKNLIPFVLRLMDKNQAQAIPLILRIDFDALTDEEYSRIFTAPEIHEQNINYFAAAAMSSVNQVANFEIKGYRKGFKEAKKKLEDPSDKKVLKETAKIDEVAVQRTTELDRFRTQLDAQQDTIKDLDRALTCQKEELRNAIKRAHTSKTNEELLKEAQEKLSRILEDGRNNLLQMIKDDEACERDVLNQMLDEANDKLNQKMEGLPPLPNDIIDDIKKYRDQFEDIENHLNDVKNELVEARSLMVAKIIRDKLRLDEFLRKTDKKFDILDDAEKFNLTDLSKEKVREAEQKVIELEEKLEKACPIIGKQSKQ